jgi:FlaA1/EpsC-like NDP-sugar epimerase
MPGALSLQDYESILKVLGRCPRPFDCNSLSQFFSQRVVLVTGAAGSIGSQLVRQLCLVGPVQIIALDFSESQTFQARLECIRENPAASTLVVHLVGSVEDSIFLRRIIKQYSVNTVFHAAAYKHVPLMEVQPYQAIKNNIGGTLNLLTVCTEQEVDVFVNISTDKAVNPWNVMGATKRVNEMLVRAVARTVPSAYNYVSVRFGNVFGSSGSVGPIFADQISRGGPVLITHLDMTRFMMSIREAVTLVLVASSMSNSNGDIFLLNMGHSIRVVDLARAMIRYMGYGEGEISVKVAGIRPGEKMHEDLYWENEQVKPTDVELIYRVVEDSGTAETDLADRVEKLLSLNNTKDDEEIMQYLGKIVPFQHPPANLSPQLQR